MTFELTPESFTLPALQRSVGALSGRRLHKQNFRRLVETSAIVEAMGDTTMKSGGRPAALFRFRRNVAPERSARGSRVGIKG